MASGLPAIGLKSDPPRTLVATEEIISEGVDGFAVEPDNPAALARKIDLILNNAILQKRMGEAAIKKCQEKFRWEAHFHNIIYATQK